MCNIILINFKKHHENNSNIVLSTLPYLQTRGRDRYSMFIPSTTTVYSTTKFSELECVEAVESLPWKWWKYTEPDIENVDIG